MKNRLLALTLSVAIAFSLIGCSTDNYNKSSTITEVTEITAPIESEVVTDKTSQDVSKATNDDKSEESATGKEEIFEYNGTTYNIISVDGGDQSGTREANVAVNIGFGDRVYWGLTNEYGQLVTVIADKIILQNDATEPVNSDGRYYDDEAKVPGTERKDLDEGHVIADSLGGVSNAYNITPQNSTLNRNGDQAYMEKVIRDAGGCENFIATITYPDTTTQIPSHYHYEYDLLGNHIIDDFDNIDPDVVNDKMNKQSSDIKSTSNTVDSNLVNESEELKKIDTNGNGIVTIAEAKAAGYSMPIYSDHWLYKYMKDADGDGMVGE